MSVLDDFKKHASLIVDKIIEKQTVRQYRINRCYDKINVLSDFDFQKFIKDVFIPYETDFEERFYKKGILTNSNISSILLSIVSQHGEDLNLNEDFLSESYKFKGLIFKYYNGQGFFYRILDDEDNLLFQSL